MTDEEVANLMTPAECRSARGALRWTKLELATKAGVNVWSVSHFERSGRGTQDGVVAKIREALLDGGVLITSENGFSVVRFDSAIGTVVRR